MKKIVIALGGNAILTDNPTAKGQEAALKKTAQQIAKFINESDEDVKLVVTHGNGPQVGNLLLQELNGSSKENPPMPLATCVAMTQGQIGFWLQDAFSDQQLNSATVVTRALVSKDDPAFENPSKPIGPFYKDKAQVQAEHPDWVLIEDAGRGYRRVVPSPKPISILEHSQINDLVENNGIVIAGGGGGIPVIQDENDVTGVEAVIDKDFTSALIAEMIGADQLIILTSVSQVAMNFNQPNQKELANVNLKTLAAGLKEHQFGKGSMEPKIQACMEFVKKTGKEAVITSLDNVADFAKNKRATFITR